jgi:hypothetical protein
MRKLVALVVVVLCSWYAKHVLIMVDSVVRQLTHFIH